MPVTITIRARLKGDVSSMKKIHDQVTGATKGDGETGRGHLPHRLLNPQDQHEFLGIDTWQSRSKRRLSRAAPKYKSSSVSFSTASQR